jgi:hypothetical protein
MRKLFPILLLFLLLGQAQAYNPITLGVGARALGLGNAFTAQADDGSALFVNPAGLTALEHYALADMYGSPFDNTKYFLLGIAAPFRFGTLGLGYDNFTTYNVLILAASGEVADASESQLSLVYAQKINPQLSFGTRLRFFSRGLSKDISAAAKGNGFDLDLALKYNWNPWLNIGLTAQNILPYSLGGKFTNGAGKSEGIPYVLKLGTSFKIWGASALSSFQDQELYFNSDFEQGNGLPLVLHLGAEWWPVRFLAVRLGSDQVSSLAGDQITTNSTMGIGLRYGGVAFDFVYYKVGDGSQRTENYISIGYIGEQKKVEKTEEIAPPPTPTINQIELKHFSDVPDSHWAKDAIEQLASLKVIAGYPDQTFRPDKTITRAEMCTLIFNVPSTLEAQPLNLPAFFKDVPKKHWAAKYIYSAAVRGIVTGNPDGSFKPNQKINRLEAIALIARFAGLKAGRVSESPYSDLPGRHWATPIVAAAKREGLISFIGEKLEPKKALTRAEAAVMLSQTATLQDIIKSTSFEEPK